MAMWRDGWVDDWLQSDGIDKVKQRILGVHILSCFTICLVSLLVTRLPQQR